MNNHPSIKRVLEHRMFYQRSHPFRLLEKRLVDAFELERKVNESNFYKNQKNHSKRQFFVFVVTCLESYLQEICRLMIDKKVLSAKDFMKNRDIKDKIKGLKFDILDIVTINEKEINVSELISERLNFQNLKDIKAFCNLIEFDHYFKAINAEIKRGEIGRLALPRVQSKKSMEEFVKMIAREKNKSLKNLKISHALTLTIIKYMYQKMDLDKEKIFGTIEMGIWIRHKIVHKAVDINIKDWQVFSFLMATIQLCAIVQEIFNIKKEEINISGENLLSFIP